MQFVIVGGKSAHQKQARKKAVHLPCSYHVLYHVQAGRQGRNLWIKGPLVGRCLGLARPEAPEGAEMPRPRARQGAMELRAEKTSLTELGIFWIGVIGVIG